MLIDVFAMALEYAPSVVFIDEFDGLFGERFSSSSRLTSTLLSAMDNLIINKDESKNKGRRNSILVLAATNAPWSIDRAFYSRFDQIINVSLPNEDESIDILRKHLLRMKVHSSTSIDEICNSVAPKLKGFSGADIGALCRAAAVNCLLDDTDSRKGLMLRNFKDVVQTFDASSDIAAVKRCQVWKRDTVP